MVRQIGNIVRWLMVAALGSAIVMASAPAPTRAAVGNELERVRGTVGYEPTPGDFHQIFGRIDLDASATAVTREKSAAVVALPDSSLVSLGENTSVSVGALVTAADGPGSTISLNGGSLRFDVKRPAGGHANYRFTTATSQIAVRGTIGLISFLGGNTTVVCLACQADSVAVTVGNQTFTLLTGQALTVSAAGAVTTGAMSTLVEQSFTSASVPIDTEPTTVGAGLPATTTAAAGAGGGATAAIAGVAAAAGIAAAAGSHAAPAAAPTAAPTATPTPSPTPSTQGGTINLNGIGRRPAGIPGGPAAPGAPTAPSGPTAPGMPTTPGLPGGFPGIPGRPTR